MSKYKMGDIIKCKVSGITNYGFFAKIDKDYVGLCHISEVSNDFVKDIVRDGDIELIDNMVEFYRKPFGCQIYVKSYQNKKLVLVHNLLGEREIVVPVQGKLIQAYTTEHYCVRKDSLSVSMRECSAGAFLIEG